MLVRDAEDMSSAIVWPSGVWTFTRFRVVSTAVTVARTILCASLPLMSVDDWEGTCTVTVGPFQSYEWYVVVAPSTDTIVATGCVGAAFIAHTIAVATNMHPTIPTRVLEDV